VWKSHYYEKVSKLSNKKAKLDFIATILTILLLISWFVALKAIYWYALDWKTLSGVWNIFTLLFYLIISSGAFIFIPISIWKPSFIKPLKRFLIKSKGIKWIIYGLICTFPMYFLVYSPWSFIFTSFVLRLVLYLGTIIILTFIGNQEKHTLFTLKTIIASLLLTNALFFIGQRLRDVVDYPFSLKWSEGNRFWDYSILFGSKRYVNLSDKPIVAFIELGRQSLWGLAFLIPNLSIKGMRLWNSFLFIVPNILLGLMLFWKKWQNQFLWLLCGLWTLLFLNQGPIYTPLVISAIIVIIASRLPLFVSLPLVALAGYYTNLSRYTWSLAPAIWAILLTINAPIKNKTAGIHWRRVIAEGFVGLLGGLILPSFLPLQANSPEVYPQSTQSIFSIVTSTLTHQKLIWSRLVPNSTNNLGILLALLLAIFPLCALLITFAKRSGWRLNVWQKLAVWGSLGTFFSVGIVASVKIGGGSNLHNLDMFLITLVILTGVAWRHSAQLWLTDLKKHTRWETLLIIILVTYPIVSNIYSSIPLSLPAQKEQQGIIDFIQKIVDEHKEYGEILFLDQRQLLTFGYIKDVPLVVDYEKKLLMNEALSSNSAYFHAFYEDLKHQRFSLIINEPIWIGYQSEEIKFGEENDAYVKWVSEPLLCYYEPYHTFRNVGVELLIPRTKPPELDLNCP